MNQKMQNHKSQINWDIILGKKVLSISWTNSKFDKEDDHQIERKNIHMKNQHS